MQRLIFKGESVFGRLHLSQGEKKGGRSHPLEMLVRCGILVGRLNLIKSESD